MNLLIKHALVINPADCRGEISDIYIKDGVITDIAPGIPADTGCETIDAAGMWAVPGLIDMHVHLRDPGQIYKEDIETGAAAAAAGGFTGILAMPNTLPPVDNTDTVSYILEKAKKTAPIDIYPCGCITKGMQGAELTDIAALAAAGVIAVSEDGKSVADTRVMTDALLLCKKYGLPMLSHCEDPYLAEAGADKGYTRAADCRPCGEEADDRYLSVLAEELYAARDIMLAEYTGARLHICHVSTAGSVRLIREAKKRGVPVTAEAAPHHFILSMDDIPPDGSANFKMNPPLRTKTDVSAVLEGLKDGTVDCIATDHAPHADYEKKDRGSAANGIIGLETALPLCITYLVKQGILQPAQLIEKMSANPAGILGIDGGSLVIGKKADIAIIDPDAEYVIDPGAFRSKSRNTPFGGFKVAGRVMYTVKNGRIIYKS